MILVLILALFSFSQGICNDISWNSPVLVSDLGVDSSDPQVVVDTNGNITAVWVEGSVIKATTFAVGGSPSSIVTLSGSTASYPRIGIDSNGNVIAVWLENGVVNASTMPAGGSWSAEVAISSSSGGAASTPVVAVDSTGNAVAVWARNSLIETATQLAGGSWDSAITLTSSNTSDNPRVAISDSSTHQVVAVWHSLVSANDQIQAITGTIGVSGVTWSGTTSTLAANNGHHQNYPRATLDPFGNALASWFQYDLAGTYDTDYINVTIMATGLAAGSTTWITPNTAVSNPGMRNPAEFSYKGKFNSQGGLIGVWTSSTDGSTFNVESSSKALGQPFTGSVLIVILNPYTLQSDLATNSLGQAVVPFMYYDGTNITIQVTETNFGGFISNFFSPFQLLSSGTNNGYPRAATSYKAATTTIYAAVVWIQNNGSNNVIQAATGSKGIVLPPTNVGVNQTTNSNGIFTEYVNTITWTASADPNLLGYVVYRDGLLFAQLVPTATQMVDHHRAQQGTGSPVTYAVVAFDAQFQQSPITASTTVTVP